MFEGLRQRWRVWWLARHPRTDTWTLTQRNVYILPTRAGAAFGLTLFAMLLATINFQLNLGYVLVFLLAGAGLVSMHVTHNTLRGLTLQLRPPSPGFAGTPVPIEVVLAAGTRARFGLRLHFDDGQPADEAKAVYADIPAGAQQGVTLSVLPEHRGYHDLAPVTLETRFPFGLFRAWTVWVPAARVLAWPRPEQPAPPWPAQAQSTASGERVQSSRDGGEWEGVRAWRRGDPMKRLVWKKVARTGELVSRETSSVETRELWFDYQHAHGKDAEARLSRLTAWIVAAHGDGVPHGLRLPGVEVQPDVGDGHRRRQLDLLATWA